MEQIWETREQEKLAEMAEKDGCAGLIESLKVCSLIQIEHLVSTQRFDDACKVIGLLERVKAI